MTHLDETALEAAHTAVLPCPFCGKNAQIAPDEIGSGGQHVPPYHAGCFRGAGCGIAFTADDPDEAVAEWNRRAALPAQPAGEPVGVRCTGCGSHWDDERLKAEKAKNIALKSCCPERDMRPVYYPAPASDAVREALQLAANRLRRLSVDFPTGSLEFIETGEWATEAETALSSAPQRDEAGEVERLRSLLDAPLICDVRIPGATFRRGVSTETLLKAMKRREDWAEEDRVLDRATLRSTNGEG